MNKLYSAAILFGIAAFALWLIRSEEAARPGSLSSFHEGAAVCEDCHIPWHGVSNEKCLACHDFEDVSLMLPEIRFHESEKFCVECHMEHKGLRADISTMDHTLLNARLLCTACHFDPHENLFGDECRACHRIESWKIEGFQHPLREKRNCNRCHRAPKSHYAKDFWAKIEKGHLEKDRSEEVREECWRCHTPKDWRHLFMRHEL